MKLSFTSKIALGVISLFIMDLFNIFFFGMGSNLNMFIFVLISNLLIALLLGYYVQRSTLTGKRLMIALFFIYFLIGHFNILIEAYIFNVTDRVQTLSQIIQGFVHSLIIAPLFVTIFGKWKSEEKQIKFEKRSVWSWVWRTLVGTILYLFFYLLAGFTLQAVYPELHEFYAGKIPPFGVMISTQFIRAPIFILVTVIIIRTLDQSNLSKAIYTGLFFAILGGIAPLIIPNELMPEYIRYAHLIEVGFSNFLFGFILTYLFKQKLINPI